MVGVGFRPSPGPLESLDQKMDSGWRLPGLFPEILVPSPTASWAQNILSGSSGHALAVGFECPLAGIDPDFAILTGEGAGLPFPLPDPIAFVWFSYEAGRSVAKGPAGIHMGFDIKHPIHSIDSSLRASIRSVYEASSHNFAVPEDGWEFPDCLQKALQAIPEGTEIWNISRIPSRAGWPWKLNLSLPRKSLYPFLENCGWPGDLNGLTEHIGWFAAAEEMIRMDIGFAADMLPRIGLEIFAGLDRFRESDRILALDRLVDLDLCRQEKRLAVQSWRGLKFISPWERSGTWFAITNWYLKLCLEQDGMASAKAYLYCRPVPLPAA